MDTTRTGPKRGFALPAAVFALVVVGVLVTGGFYLARQETRVGVASERASASFYLAERGASEVMSVWDGSRFGPLSLWGSATVADTTDDGIWSVSVTRVSSRLYFLLASGAATAGEAVYGRASRVLGIVARLRSANMDPSAALSTVGELRFGGSAQIFGQDYVPPAWTGTCDPAGPAKPGVLIDDRRNIKYTGHTKSIDGDPDILEDPGLTPEDLLLFGDMKWEDLVAMATIIFPSGESTITQLLPDSVDVGGSWFCDSSSKTNWGDPYHPSGVCGSYFPVIYSRGDLKISASDGDGRTLHRWGHRRQRQPRILDGAWRRRRTVFELCHREGRDQQPEPDPGSAH
jgi:Tfp pilus assembly protein PilV